MPLPPLETASGGNMEPSTATTMRPLPEVSEAVRARVAQRLRGASIPFLLTDEEYGSDDDDTTAKRKRSMKSGKLRTLDTHVTIQVKWPHEMVRSASSKAPVYEAAFTDGYLGMALSRVKCHAEHTS